MYILHQADEFLVVEFLNKTDKKIKICADLSLLRYFQHDEDLCQRLLGRYPPRPRSAHDDAEKTATRDGHHCVRGQFPALLWRGRVKVMMMNVFGACTIELMWNVNDLEMCLPHVSMNLS